MTNMALICRLYGFWFNNEKLLAMTVKAVILHYLTVCTAHLMQPFRALFEFLRQNDDVSLNCAFSWCYSAGILIVVAIGVALGVFIGGTLLSVVAFCMKK